MNEIRDIIAEFARRRGEPLALATLVRARGSSYRRPGARMLIASDGSTVGTLSGGCLEEEVARRAQDVIATGKPLLLSFDTRLRYGCHGSIDIFIERARSELLDNWPRPSASGASVWSRPFSREINSLGNGSSSCLTTRLLEPLCKPSRLRCNSS